MTIPSLPLTLVFSGFVIMCLIMAVYRDARALSNRMNLGSQGLSPAVHVNLGPMGAPASCVGIHPSAADPEDQRREDLHKALLYHEMVLAGERLIEALHWERQFSGDSHYCTEQTLAELSARRQALESRAGDYHAAVTRWRAAMPREASLGESPVAQAVWVEPVIVRG